MLAAKTSDAAGGNGPVSESSRHAKLVRTRQAFRETAIADNVVAKIGIRRHNIANRGSVGRIFADVQVFDRRAGDEAAAGTDVTDAQVCLPLTTSTISSDPTPVKPSICQLAIRPLGKLPLSELLLVVK